MIVMPTISTPIDRHTCPACKARNGTPLDPHTPPPFDDCKNPNGCRCVIKQPPTEGISLPVVIQRTTSAGVYRESVVLLLDAAAVNTLVRMLTDRIQASMRVSS